MDNVDYFKKTFVKPLDILQLVQERTYSAGEIGARLGITACMVGRLANVHGLKTPKYGKLFYDKAKTAEKQVETWRYYENVIPVLKSLLDMAEAV